MAAYDAGELIQETACFVPVALLAGAWFASATFAAADTTPACRSTVSGDLRLHSLKSGIFGNTRTIRVLLPPGYDAPENAATKYPCSTCSTARMRSTHA